MCPVFHNPYYCLPKNCCVGRWQHNSEWEWKIMLWNSCGLDTLVLPPNSPVSESLHRDRAVRTGAFPHWRLFNCITIYNLLNRMWFESSVLPDIAMIVAGNTRHGSIPVICVSGFLYFLVDQFNCPCWFGGIFLFVRLRQRQQGLWQGLVLVLVQAWLPPWTLSR